MTPLYFLDYFIEIFKSKLSIFTFKPYINYQNIFIGRGNTYSFTILGLS